MQVIQKGRFTLSMPEAKDVCKISKTKSRFSVVYGDASAEHGQIQYPSEMVSRKGRFTVQYHSCAGHSTTEFDIRSKVIEFIPKNMAVGPHHQDNSTLPVQVLAAIALMAEAPLIDLHQAHIESALKSSRFSLIKTQSVDAKQLAGEGAVQKGRFYLDHQSANFKVIEFDEKNSILFDSYSNFDMGFELLKLKQRKLVSTPGRCTLNYLCGVQARAKISVQSRPEFSKPEIPERSAKFLDIRRLFEGLYHRSAPHLVIA